MESKEIKKMSVAEFLAQNGDAEVINNPNTNKMFFVTSNGTRGYVSSACAEDIRRGGKEKKQFVLKNCLCAGGEMQDLWILQMVGDSKKNVVTTLRAEDF